ncbi:MULTISPECIES: hypothetical protein [unclassified Mycolicibacterium]|uniref:hypothetical protein n=1 Tax=unclassified Mycolicibacterium TaxID=2636767 RepID=UPI002EDA6E4E
MTQLLAGSASALAVALAPEAAADEPSQCQSGGTPGGVAGPPTCEVTPPAVTGTPGPTSGPGIQNGPYGPAGEQPPVGH